MNVVDAFQQLATPSATTGERVYAVTDASPGVWVGKGPEGQAALLVRGETTARPPLVTRYVRADFGAPCRLQLSHSVVDESATIVECTSTDPSVLTHFLVAVSATLSAAQEFTSRIDARAALRALVEVFQAMSRPALTSVQGLWGELYLIANSADPSLLVDAWHNTAQDRHDFAMSTQRIEVKTTTARRRHHRFAHDQLASLDEEDLLVASLQLESAATGVTTSNLLHKATDRLGVDGERRLRLVTGVAAALGEDWEAAERQRYDEAAARRSVQYYDRSILPALPADVPHAIFDIHYSIDLAGVPTLSDADLRSRSGIHRAIRLVPSSRPGPA